ncbi:MAG TPA: DUF302 domain-containing protein [Deltaproteobacteria bacterium]|nr:DUF302 domain-containing protein [Deltaproteobacteria bacterium]
MARYGIIKTLELDYEEAIDKVKEALAKEGFGVLTEIDVKATLKKKLDKDFRRYMILGACNPNYAHTALTIETAIGLLMPCNVIVYENDEGGSTVGALDPAVAFSVIDNPALAQLAKEVRDKLESVINSL